MVNERLLVGGGGGGTLCDMAGESVREVCFYVRRGSLSLCCWSGGVMCFAGKVGNRVEEGRRGDQRTGVHGWGTWGAWGVVGFFVVARSVVFDSACRSAIFTKVLAMACLAIALRRTGYLGIGWWP